MLYQETKVNVALMGVTTLGIILGNGPIEFCWKNYDTFSEWPISTLGIATISTASFLTFLTLGFGRPLLKRCTALPPVPHPAPPAAIVQVAARNRIIPRGSPANGG